MEQETDRNTKWKLKKINKCWFLDVGGNLKGMNILNYAKDVYMEDNIIFADDKMYQLTESNNDVLITEIQDICQTDKPPECEKKEPILKREKEESNANGNNRTRELDVNRKENNEIHLNVKQDAIQSSSTWDLTPTEDTEYDDNSESDSEQEMNHELASDLYVSEEDTQIDNEALSDREQEESYELGSKQYVRKEGKMKGFFKRIKKSIVQRKPPFKQTDAQTRRKSLYRPENKEEWRIDTKFDDDDIDLYSDYGNLQQYSRSDDAPTVSVSDDLDAHDDAPKEPASGASNDDDCSFRKEDNLKLYEETRLWCKMGRKEAEEQLLIPDTPSGTFLIRESREGNSLVLSVRDFDPKTNNAYVRHYRIHRTKNGGFYITPKRPFDNMLDLIFHYRSNVTDLLYGKLKIPDTVIQPLVEFRELEVSRESVKLLKKLGSGSFAEFYLSNLLNTVDVAVKTLKQGQMTADDFMAEAKLMHHLRHNKLVQLMAVCTKSEPIYIITELMINGTLIDYLRYDRGRTIDFNLLAYMAGQIADGMAYMETKNYVHRNLRATNILVGDHNKVKVAGFRLARSIHESFDDAHGHTKLPTKWTAPEAAFYRKFSIKSDVWSYGVLLYELITFGSDPYAGMNGLVVLKRLEAGFRMDKPEPYYIPCPDPYYEIMLKCWNSIADSRPTFAFLQDYFNNYMIYAEEMQFISQYTREQTPHSDDTRKLGATGGCVDDYEAETRLDPQQSMQVSSPQIYESVPNAVTTEQTHRGSNTDKLGITSGFSVKALYDYEAGADDEISLYTDDIITNVDPANEHWWMGTTTNGTRGLFPSNYVEIFENAYAEVTKH